MTRFSYTLRKHPIARFSFIALIVAAAIALLIFFTRTVTHKPVVDSISPSVGAPGDILVIKGDYFGTQRNSSYVELCGNRLTESSYIDWNNKEIRLVVPANTEDGLIYVVTNGGKSNPDFFTNELAIPVYMPENPMMSIPTIAEISPEIVYPGQVLVISGKNFGTTKEKSAVYFSAYRELKEQENIPDMGNSDSAEKSALPKYGSNHNGFIIPCEYDYDYEYWSETEIRLRVPDAAETGSIFVVTETGRSTPLPITVKRSGGQKTFPLRHTYLIQIEADVSEIRVNKNASSANSAITLHIPHPAIYSQQPEATMTESSGNAALLSYRNTSIFQIAGDENKTQASAKQNFVVQCCAVETEITKDYIAPFKERSRMLCRTYTKADEIIPADTKALEDLLPGIIFKVTNPYRRAELIFDYMAENYKILKEPRAPNSDPMDLINTKRGDAYDFAVIYTALLRTCGIPARLLTGILINADKRTQNHWWCEFYLEDFGWVPVDVALGAGLEFEPFMNERHSPKYYFGNIDAQHLAFSLNYNVIKQSVLNNKVVYKPRSFALQSVWEESSADIESYSSYWPTPVVLGIY